MAKGEELITDLEILNSLPNEVYIPRRFNDVLNSNRRELFTKENLLTRLMERRIISNDCWLLTTQNNSHGYGKITFGGNIYVAHRLSAYIFLGMNLDSTLNVNHKVIYPNKSCWNPEHLYVGTQLDNAQDMKLLNRHRNNIKTHCPKGHEYNKENTYVDNRGYRQCKQCWKT